MPAATVLPERQRLRRIFSGASVDVTRVLATALVLGLVAAAVAAAGAASGIAAGPIQVVGRAIIVFEPGISHARAREVLERVGATRLRGIPVLDAQVADLAPGVSQALWRVPGVSYVEPDTERAAEALPNDPYLPTGSGSYYGGQWGVFQTNTPQVWDAVGYGDSAVKLAVVDSGVAAGHPDLQGQVLSGRNVMDGSNRTDDTDGHGTYVAGVIGAAANNGQGIAGECGGCRILPVKVTNGGSAYDSNLAAGVTWAADNGARVVNLSFAGSSKSTTLGNAVAYARSKGVVVVAAAGNSGCDCVTYPANYPGVIAVAASSNLDGDVLQGYSNYGSWVDVSAPSGNLTTWLTDPKTGSQWGYGPVGGTSLAAPVVVGVAGLLLTKAPGLPGTELEGALVSGADPISGTAQVATGRIDAADALASVTSGTVPTSPSPSASDSPSPSPSPSDTTITSEPTPSPSSTDTGVSPSPTPTVSTTAFSGALNRKSTSRSFTVSATSLVRTSTAFSCASLNVDVSNGGAVVALAKGSSVLTTPDTAVNGAVQVTVSGSTKCSFTLTVTTQ